jgi:hypothetical protein
MYECTCLPACLLLGDPFDWASTFISTDKLSLLCTDFTIIECSELEHLCVCLLLLTLYARRTAVLFPLVAIFSLDVSNVF